MAKKVMLKFATCTKVKQSLYSLAQLILQFSLLWLMLRALSVPSFVSQSGLLIFRGKKAKFRGIFGGKFAEKSADFGGEKSKFAEKAADFARF